MSLSGTAAALTEHFPTADAFEGALVAFYGAGAVEPGGDGFSFGACPACRSKGRDAKDVMRFPLYIARAADGWSVAATCGCSDALILAALNGPVDNRSGDMGREEVGRYGGRRYDLSRLIEEAEIEPPWRAKPLLADAHLTVLAASGGEGKTWLTLALAAAVAAGTSTAGIGSALGRAVIFDAENGPYVLGSRLKTLAGGIDPERVAIYDAEGLRLTDPNDLAWMRGVIEEERADLFALDSLRTLAPDAAENDADDMAPVVVGAKALTRQTGAAGLLLHHRGDDPRKDFRGSTAIRDQADLLYVLERDERDPEARTRRRLRPSKVRIAAEPDPLWLSIEGVHGEVYISAADPFDPAVAGGRPVRDDLAGRILSAVGTGALTRPEIARAVGRERTDRTLRRAVDGLVDAGHLRPDGDRFCATREGGGKPPLPPLATPATDEGGTRPTPSLEGGALTPPGGNPDGGSAA